MHVKSNITKIVVFVAALALVCAAFISFAANDNSVENANGVPAAASENTVTLQIGNPLMTLNGVSMEIDPGRGTVPVTVSNRTLVPIRAIIESLGGSVDWNEEQQQVTLIYDGDVIKLTIGSQTAYLNEEEQILDVAPAVINDRTMLPIRFVAEGFQFHVDWKEETQTVEITTSNTTQTTSLAHQTTEETAPVVYMTTKITPEAMVKIYQKLDKKVEGKVAVKLSTGEAGNTHYLDPNLIKDLVQSVDGTIVECNTAYGGSRASTAMHKQVAADHGFTAIADVDIMDENGDISIPVTGGDNLTENFVGANLANYDSILCLSHFKGHAMGGFGGAIKNMSIGIASSEGKGWIHTAGKSKTDIWGGVQDNFLEAMAEATSAVVDYMDGKVVYINVMNHLSVDCDCDGNPAKPEMDDVGILASTDPVALDQACVDIVYGTDRAQSGALIERMESRNGIHTLEQAVKMGLGSRSYRLVDVD